MSAFTVVPSLLQVSTIQRASLCEVLGRPDWREAEGVLRIVLRQALV
jgi:hypothetical protein